MSSSSSAGEAALIDTTTGGEEGTSGSIVPPSLRLNMSWTFAGNVIYGGCQWAMLIAIARLGNPQMVGTFALGQAITAPLILFSNLQLRAIQATDSNDRYEFGHYLALRIVTTVLAFAVIVALALLGRYGPETIAVIVIVGLAKSIESMSDIYFGLLQHHEEMSRIAKSMIAKGILSITVLSVTLYFTKQLVLAAAAMAAMWLLVFVVYDRRSADLCKVAVQRPIWRRQILSKLAWVAFPLGLTMMLISLNANLPRYFLEHYMGTRQLGLFSALATIQAAGMLVVMAIGNAAIPRLARYYHAGDWPQFRRLTLFLVVTCIGLGVATIIPVALGGNALITFIFGPEYGGQTKTFFWLAFAAAVSYCSSAFGYAATAAERIKFQPFAFGLVAACTAIGCYFFVPRFGGLGAAITMCGAAALGCVLYLFSFAGTARSMRKIRDGEGFPELVRG